MILLSIVQDMILVMLVLLRIQGGDNYRGGDAECSDNGNDGNYAGDDGDIDDNGDVGGETNVGVCCKNEPETDKDDVKKDIDDDDIDGGDGSCCTDDVINGETDNYDGSGYNCVRDVVDSDDGRFKSNPRCSCIESG